MTEKGKEYLLKTKELILARPNSLKMSEWIDNRDGSTGECVDDIRSALKNTEDKDPFKCDTACCIAGWVAMLAVADGERQRKDDWGDSEPIPDFAMRVLGIDYSDLFYSCSWPYSIMNDYYEADNNEGEAKMAAEAIDRFIKGNGSFEDE